MATNQGIQLNDEELVQYKKVWVDLVRRGNWDDVYEWSEQEYQRYDVNEKVAMCLFLTVQLVVFGQCFVYSEPSDTVIVHTRPYYNGQG